MSFPKYPEYKDSGVEWLGDVPGHWRRARFKEVFEERNERSIDGLEELLSVSAYYGVKPRADNIDEGDHLSRAQSLEGYKKCYPGDLVINIMLAWNRGLGVSWTKGIVSPAYSVFRIVGDAAPRFLDFLVRSDEYIQYFKAYSAGVIDSRLRLYPEVFGRLICSLPAIQEQFQIARFLDHETTRIDALIAEQQRLIELLKKKLQAVIFHAVTKGLDPNRPMKNSEVEWLGEVPEHWRVARIKHIAKLESGHTPDKKQEAYWEDCDIPWVSLNDSKTLKGADYIDDTAYKVNRLGLENSSARLLPARAVVFTRDASIGLCAITARKMAVSQHIIAWISYEHLVIPEYLLLVFYAMETELIRYTFGATIKTIGMDDVKSLAGAFPSLEEQREIVDYVFHLKRKLTAAIKDAEDMVSLLHERRSALVSAAVTGKIDVTNWRPDKARLTDSCLQAAENPASYA